MHGPTCIFWANLTPFSRQRRTLFYRYAARGFSTTVMDPEDYAPFRAKMSPLGQAILEPAGYHGRGRRTDIAALLEADAAVGSTKATET
jgi:hypothetical protein